MGFEKEELKSFRTDFKSAVKDLEAQYGVKIDMGNINYESSEFRTKLTVTKRSANSLTLTPSPNASLESYVGSKVAFNGTKYEVVGVKANRPKYPLVMEREDGKKFKVSVDQVRNNIK